MRDPQEGRLVVDRSPAQHIGAAEVRAWGSDQTVFILSVMRDMQPERAAVAAAIERVGATPVMFERLGGRDDGPQLAYLEGVRGADIYVGILGGRYGVPDETGYSPTHREYNEAVHQGLRISVWTTTVEQDGRQRDLLDEVRVFHTTGSYTSADELGTKIEVRLRELAEQAGSPWCKVGPAVFRATRFTDTGARLQIEAAVRNDDVVAVLEGLRPGQWGRSGDTRITCAGRTYLARIDSVVVEATAGRARRVTVEATPQEDRGSSSLLGATFDGRSPEDLTELALRVSLFGEDNPLGTMSFFAEMTDPFGPLRSLELSEEVLPSMAEVLLVETLVGSGRAERVTAFRMGPQHGGAHQILVEWLPVRRFSNVEPVVRSVEGQVGL